MVAPYTIFDKTKMVEVVVYENDKKIDSDVWDEEYWIRDTNTSIKYVEDIKYNRTL